MDKACDRKVLGASDARRATAGIEVGGEPALVDRGESLCRVLAQQAKLGIDTDQLVLDACLHSFGVGAPRDLDGFLGFGMVDALVYELRSTF